MTRTDHGSLAFPGYRVTSGGVLSSLPGQNGQVSTKDGVGWTGRCVTSSSGRLARSVAMMTHSLVKKFWRSSGIVILPNVYRQQIVETAIEICGASHCVTIFSASAIGKCPKFINHKGPQRRESGQWCTIT